MKFFTKLRNLSSFLSKMKRSNIVPLIFAVFLIMTPSLASAEIGGLTKCSQSKAFDKRLNSTVKKLEARKQNYEENTPPAIALQQQIDRTNTRFTKYSRSELLCGADGLPHLIADGRWSYAGEFIVPGFSFIYVSGWIGWVGRKYLRTVSTLKNPTENEIIIDVPLALKIITTGYIWPVSAWQEFINNDLVASDEKITISTR